MHLRDSSVLTTFFQAYMVHENELVHEEEFEKYCMQPSMFGYEK